MDNYLEAKYMKTKSTFYIRFDKAIEGKCAELTVWKFHFKAPRVQH